MLMIAPATQDDKLLFIRPPLWGGGREAVGEVIGKRLRRTSSDSKYATKAYFEPPSPKGKACAFGAVNNNLYS